MQAKAPVIVVGCKLDLRKENQLVSLESLTTNIMQQFTEIVTCVECSAATLYQVCCFAASLLLGCAQGFKLWLLGFMCFLILLEIWTNASGVGTTVIAYPSETLLLWAKSQLRTMF